MSIHEAFDAARPRLEAALSRANGLYDIDDIKRMVLTEQAQLWHSEGFSGITEVINYPQKRVVLVHLAGGDLAMLKQAIAKGGELDRFAEIVGAKAILINGRKGWERALADDGYRPSFTQVTKEL